MRRDGGHGGEVSPPEAGYDESRGIPMYGKFKEDGTFQGRAPGFWNSVLQRVDFKLRQAEKVEDIKKGGDGIFTVVTPKNQYRAHAVILALGKGGQSAETGDQRRGPPQGHVSSDRDRSLRKTRKSSFVGGGDSAVEAAMGLAYQVGNNVTLSYRKEAFSRIKERKRTSIGRLHAQRESSRHLQLGPR